MPGRMSGEQTFEKVKKLLQTLILSDENYRVIESKMFEAMRRGLTKLERQQTSIKMYPSYVFQIPNGTERGTFLALDLGGTNYRVILARLPGEQKPPEIEERTHAIPPDKMLGSGMELFDYIAQTLKDFLKFHQIIEQDLQLGFTFSFPCEQHGLNKSVLVRWTKGFDASGVVGENVCNMLQQAMDKLGLHVKCIAVVNDTVGTLAACALEDPKCAIGLIIGTGTNAAYVESVASVETLVDEGKASDQHVVINTEWGAFGEQGELDSFITPWDKELDTQSLHPGQHLYEKMCSGSYIGELVRLIIQDLTKRELLFQGKFPETLNQRNSFLTKYITEAERDPAHLFYSTQYMLSENLKVPIAEPIDFKIVRYVCEIVSMRAAFLIGTGIAVLLRKIAEQGRKKITVAIDGSLYKFHPKFRERMTDIIDKLKPADVRFHLRLSEDGSGKGAAAIVAATSRTS